MQPLKMTSLKIKSKYFLYDEITLSNRLERKYWGSESLEKFPEALFQELMTDDAALLQWLRQLEVFGFVKVNGAPAEIGQVRRLAERISFIRKTHYG